MVTFKLLCLDDAPASLERCKPAWRERTPTIIVLMRRTGSAASVIARLGSPSKWESGEQQRGGPAVVFNSGEQRLCHTSPALPTSGEGLAG